MVSTISSPARRSSACSASPRLSGMLAATETRVVLQASVHEDLSPPAAAEEVVEADIEEQDVPVEQVEAFVTTPEGDDDSTSTSSRSDESYAEGEGLPLTYTQSINIALRRPPSLVAQGTITFPSRHTDDDNTMSPAFSAARQHHPTSSQPPSHRSNNRSPHAHGRAAPR